MTSRNMLVHVDLTPISYLVAQYPERNERELVLQLYKDNFRKGDQPSREGLGETFRSGKSTAVEKIFEDLRKMHQCIFYYLGREVQASVCPTEDGLVRLDLRTQYDPDQSSGTITQCGETLSQAWDNAFPEVEKLVQKGLEQQLKRQEALESFRKGLLR